MKKIIFILFISIFFSGCASSLTKNIKSVLSRYENIVFENGISLKEAEVIAQKTLIKKNLVRLYDLSKPQTVKDVSDLSNHENYWFISFKEKKAANIEFIFVVIINKRTGSIKFADDYKKDRKWVLEAALLR